MLRHNICMRPHSPVLQYITFYLPWLHWQKTNNSRTTPIPINPSRKPLSPGWCSAPCSPASGKTSISSVSYRWYIPKMILATWQMKVPLSSFLISVTSRLKEPEPWTGSLSLSVLVSVSMMTTVMIKKIPLPSVYENCFIHVNVVFPFHGWFACSSRLLRGSQFSDTVPLGGEPITYLSPLFFSAFDILRTRTWQSWQVYAQIGKCCEIWCQKMPPAHVFLGFSFTIVCLHQGDFIFSCSLPRTIKAQSGLSAFARWEWEMTGGKASVVHCIL